MQTNVKTAVLLVGGASLRMYPLTVEKPKCMIEINGKPILYWSLKWLRSHGIENVVLGVAYKKEVVIDYIKNNDFGLNIVTSEHSVEGETGEGFRFAINRYINDDNFVAMNGDELTNMNLEKMIEFHINNKAVATIAISPLRSPFGIIELQEDNIVGFKEKPILTDKFVSTGIYIFNSKIKNYLPEKGHIEKTAFPMLAETGVLKAYKLNLNEMWTTVNTVKDIMHANEEFKLMGFED